jgi:hypothetical protein
MLRQGPLPLAVHGILEYVLGVLFIAAPWLLSFDTVGEATAICIVVGVGVILLAATTQWPPSLVNVVPIGLHIAFDVALGAFLIASSFLFDFEDVSAPRILTIVVGVAELLVVVATRWRSSDEATGRTAYG